MVYSHNRPQAGLGQQAILCQPISRREIVRREMVSPFKKALKALGWSGKALNLGF